MVMTAVRGPPVLGLNVTVPFSKFGQTPAAAGIVGTVALPLSEAELSGAALALSWPSPAAASVLVPLSSAIAELPLGLAVDEQPCTIKTEARSAERTCMRYFRCNGEWR